MHRTHGSTGWPLADQAQPLSTLIRERVAGDAELRALRDQLQAHVFRGIEWWNSARKRAATSRLLRLAPALPPTIRPVDYTGEAVEAKCGADPRTAHLRDPWAAIWSHRIRTRLATLLTTLFDELRSAELGATGRAAVDPTMPVEIPPDIWTSNATAVEVSTGNVLIGETRAFIDVVVAPPASTRSVSRSSIDRFIVRFDEAMQAASRRFILAELVATSRQHLGDVSVREVSGALERSSPAAWAGSGRRAAALKPTHAELEQAGRLAAESHA